jgi:hypothetical protein
MSKPIDPQLAELLVHQEESGLSVAAYSREHDIPKWKRAFRVVSPRVRVTLVLGLGAPPWKMREDAIHCCARKLGIPSGQTGKPVTMRRFFSTLFLCRQHVTMDIAFMGLAAAYKKYCGKK